MTKVSVIGLGKLGSPLLAVLAASGLEVCGIDLNAEVVAKIDAGIAPVEEPRLQQLLTAARRRIRASSDWHVAIGDSAATFLLVPTPSGADGAFRNDHLLAALDEVGRVLKSKPGYHLVVVSSTVMPGSTGGPLRERLEAASGRRVGRDIGLCYNPEFVALGNVVEGLRHPDFVLIGESDPAAGTMLEGILRRVVGERVPVARMNLVNAELTKVSVNAYVTMKISFANMLSEMCDNLAGADVDVVTAGLGHDTRIGGKYLRGATAYGGPCFPRDTVAFAAMARRVGVEATLALATHAINERQLSRITEVILERTVSGDSVAVLGLSYKPDTSVIEQSHGLMLAAALDKSGRRVVAHDPLAMDSARACLGPAVSFAASPAQAVKEADAVAVMLPSKEYRDFFETWSPSGRPRLVVDCWRIVDLTMISGEIEIVQPGSRRLPALAEIPTTATAIY